MNSHKFTNSLFILFNSPMSGLGEEYGPYLAHRKPWVSSPTIKGTKFVTSDTKF